MIVFIWKVILYARRRDLQGRALPEVTAPSGDSVARTSALRGDHYSRPLVTSLDRILSAAAMILEALDGSDKPSVGQRRRAEVAASLSS